MLAPTRSQQSNQRRHGGRVQTLDDLYNVVEVLVDLERETEAGHVFFRVHGLSRER